MSESPLSFDELMEIVKATPEERILCAVKLAKLRAYKTIDYLVDARKVTLNDILDTNHRG